VYSTNSSFFQSFLDFSLGGFASLRLFHMYSPVTSGWSPLLPSILLFTLGHPVTVGFPLNAERQGRVLVPSSLSGTSTPGALCSMPVHPDTARFLPCTKSQGRILVPLLDCNAQFTETVVFSFGTGIGFFLAIVLLAAIRERLQYAKVPPALRGLGIAMMVTGLMAMAFLSFSGIKL